MRCPMVTPIVFVPLVITYALSFRSSDRLIHVTITWANTIDDHRAIITSNGHQGWDEVLNLK